jgi:hypothetical protein
MAKVHRGVALALPLSVPLLLAAALGGPATGAPPAPLPLMTPADVDQLTDAAWAAAGVTPAATSGDAEYARRVTLDVIGRIPTPDEAERFFSDQAPDKRARLVDRLLASPEYAEHWADVALDLFVGQEFRKPGLEKRLEPRAFFASAFRENKPYDRMVREMLTFSGEIVPNGPGVFVASHVKGGGPEMMASAAARLFLGVQIQCAQCHDHPYDDRYKQEDFYGLVAYFARTKTKQEKPAAPALVPAAATAAAAKPPAAGANQLAAAPAVAGDATMAGGDKASADKSGGDNNNKVFTVFDKPNGQAKFKKSGANADTVVQPKFFGRQIPPLPGEGRRDTLARAVVASDLFAKTFVDRTWAQLFGRGIVEPWDDLGGEHDPGHPPLLQRLAEDFRASGYDIKHLLRLLVSSKAYGLTSRIAATPATEAAVAAGAAIAAGVAVVPGANPNAAPIKPAPDPTTLFARAAVRRLTPEELFRSLLTATGVDRLEQLDADQIQKRIDRALKEYLFLFADEEMAEVNTFNGNIPQALLLFNGELTNQGAKARPGSTLARILAASNDPATRLRQIYLATYTRPPTALERERIVPRLAADRSPRVYEDLFFALLTSTEMLTNH